MKYNSRTFLLLNLSNSLRKSDKMLRKPVYHLSIFPNSFNKFNIMDTYVRSYLKGKNGLIADYRSTLAGLDSIRRNGDRLHKLYRQYTCVVIPNKSQVPINMSS